MSPALAQNVVNVTGPNGLVNADNGPGASVSATFTTPNDATIDTGVANFIGAAATGAGASASVNQAISLSTLPDLSVLPTNATSVDQTITATNELTSPILSSVIIPGDVLISNGLANAIAAQAIGAAASASIASRFDNVSAAGPAAGVQSTNTVTVNGAISATNSSTVTADQGTPTTPFLSANIVAGVANMIGTSATGASAGVAITQSASNSPVGTFMDLTMLPTNTAGQGPPLGTASITAINNVGGIVNASLTVTPGDTKINAGLANSITAQAIGAAADASISSRFYQITGTTPATVVASANGVTVDLLSATNNATVTSKGTLSGNATILDGVSNSISTVAIGAAAGSSISQSASFTTGNGIDLTTLPGNIVTSTTTTANNNAGAVIKSTLAVTGDSSIGNGIGNSIAAQATGATASASIASQFDNIQTNAAGGPQSGNALNLTSLSATNTPTVTASLTTANAGITNGVANSIVASAIGASAGAGITQTASNTPGVTTMDVSSMPTNTITLGGDITAVNNPTATVTASLTATSDTTNIGGGVANTIASQGVGASAGASISSRFDNVATTASPKFAAVSANFIDGSTATTITATNNAGVGATTKLGGAGTSTVSINAGVGNSIASTAVGATALASINQSASWSTVAGGSTSLTQLPSNTVSINPGAATGISASNTGTISAAFTQLGSATSTTSIGGGVLNSISAQAVGASAGASISQVIHNVHN